MTHHEQLILRVKEYLDSQDWHYTIEDDKPIIRLGINIKSKLKNCQIIIFIGERDICIYSVPPIKASQDVYSNVVEFITRANYGLKLGKFEFDYSDGEVRYQCCLVCSESVPTLREVESCVDVGFLMLSRYGDGLVKNLMGFGSPKEDIKAIEE